MRTELQALCGFPSFVRTQFQGCTFFLATHAGKSRRRPGIFYSEIRAYLFYGRVPIAGLATRVGCRQSRQKMPAQAQSCSPRRWTHFLRVARMRLSQGGLKSAGCRKSGVPALGARKHSARRPFNALAALATASKVKHHFVILMAGKRRYWLF